MTEHVKLHFALEQDTDGYPPVAVESLWAVPTEQPFEYTLDNIPFFATQATSGDVVQVREEDGSLWFDRVVRPSGRSLIRAVFFHATKVEEVREALKRLGCSTEWNKNHHLIAISIPPHADLKSVQDFLTEQSQAGHLDYEEPILRQ